MNKNNIIPKEYFTPYQMKLPLEISQIIDFFDPVYTFAEVMNHVDLKEFIAVKGCNIGRPRCDSMSRFSAK